MNTNFPITSSNSSELEARVVGVGIFRSVPLADRATLYYGGRLASIDEEQRSFSSSGLSSAPTLLQPTQESTADGRSIVSVLGFQYKIVERLSLGAEIGLDHTEVDTVTIIRSQNGSTTQTSRGEITRNDTRAEVILRFFF